MRVGLTDRILIFGERHLRTVLAQYCGYGRHAPIIPLRILTTRGSDADRYWEG